MDEFGFPPLEVEQATMVMANITDPIDLPWNNTDNLFTRLITLKSIRRREERIIKRLKGKGMFGEVPFLLRMRMAQNILNRLCSSTPHLLSFEDCAEPPRPRSVSASNFIDRQIQRTSPQLMGGFIPTRSLTGIDLDNLDTEIPMTDIVNNI